MYNNIQYVKNSLCMYLVYMCMVCLYGDIMKSGEVVIPGLGGEDQLMNGG